MAWTHEYVMGNAAEGEIYSSSSLLTLFPNWEVEKTLK